MKKLFAVLMLSAITWSTMGAAVPQQDTTQKAPRHKHTKLKRDTVKKDTMKKP